MGWWGGFDAVLTSCRFSEAHETRTLSESGEAVHNKPETLYTLRFMSTFHKDEFLKTLFALHTKALKNHDHVGKCRTGVQL